MLINKEQSYALVGVVRILYVSLSKGDAYVIIAKDGKSMTYLVTNAYNEPE